MANEEDKTIINENSDPQSSKAENDVTGAGGRKKLFLFGGVGAGAILMGVILALFIIKPMTSGSGDEKEGSVQTDPSAPSHPGSPEKHGKQETNKPRNKSHGDQGEESAGIYTIKDIVVNPAGTGGTRFLSVSFAFDLESKELAAEFKVREAIIRDALITILSSKTVAQLTDPRQKEIARYQIKKRVSELMSTDRLAGVYYTDFVLQ